MANFRKNRLILLWFLVFAILGFSGSPQGYSQQDNTGKTADKKEESSKVKLVIVHTNDFHGNLKPLKDKKLDPDGEVGGSAYIATVIKKIRTENKGHVLLLDAGDIAQGTPVSNHFRGIPVVEVMNYLRYDAMAPGNHEFDWEQAGFEKIIKTAGFPIICANVVYEKNPERTVFNLKPYIIKNVSGVKVGILGLIAEDTPQITTGGNIKGLRFLNPMETAKKYIPRMKKDGAQIIIAITHIGFDEDKKLAEKTQGIDIIVGGHSHTLLNNPVKAGNSIIVQTGDHGKRIGRLEIIFDKKAGKITSYTEKDELIPIIHKGITPDPKVESIIEKYRKQISAIMDKEIAKTESDLTRAADSGYGDSLLGDLICDIMKEKTGAQITFHNDGGIRADILKGVIKVEDVYKVLPFDNVLVTFRYSGADIKNFLEHCAKERGSVQTAGMTFSIDYSKPEGERVSQILVNGSPIEPEKLYTVATINYVYAGGGGYVFKNTSDVKFGELTRKMFEDYIKTHSPINYKADGRIKVTGEIKR
ncbi:MAG: 5'-nucleotidase C-terminal domain-containing protein [Firmicutes bacterium]|nr:5'-nucleotidase C-terminal domain-containing protein [Bacillota bacterium]